jgi:hypothetical protein
MLTKINQYKNNSHELEYHLEELKRDFPLLRKEVNALQQDEHILEVISELDVLLTLPLVISIFEDIKKIVDNDIEQTFKDVTGKSLKTEIKKENMNDILKRILGQDIESFFHQFIKNEITQVTELNVFNLIETITKEFHEKALLPHVKDARVSRAESFNDLLSAEIFLICAILIYKEADDKQNASLFSLAWKMKGMNEEEIRKPFLALSHCAKRVKITNSTEALWKEMTLWLEGLYLNCVKQIPSAHKEGMTVKRTSDGGYPTINGKDEAFKKYFNLTMYDMSLYHLAIAEALQATLVKAIHTG